MLGRLLYVFSILLIGVLGGVETSVGKSSVLVVYDSNIVDFVDINAVGGSIGELVRELEGDSNTELTFNSYTNDSLKILINDEARYDHLVLLPPSKKTVGDKKNFNSKNLLQFINSGGNVLVVDGAASAVPDDVRSFLNELGIYPSPKNFKLIDHFNSKDGVVKLTSDNLVENRIVKALDVDYEGSAALISNNELLIPLVRGSKTAFTADEQEHITQDSVWTFGEQSFLAVALQALNNGRLTWVGADSLIAKELVDWTFQKKDVLKLQFVEHYKNEQPEKPNGTLYRIKDQVIYTVGVSELVDNVWVPYVPSSEEDTLQISFKMLDPYQRLDLKALGPAASVEDSKEKDMTIFFANFTVPDQHGMFTFDLDYKRPGLSFITDKKVVTVRHLANDEYKRSWEITNSWLYIASAFIVVVAWFSFVVNFIYITNTNKEKKNI